MLVATPLKLPKVVPDDWGKWWDIWKQAEPVKRVVNTHNPNPALHIGFEVYNDQSIKTAYQAKFVDLQTLYPSLFEQLINLPFKVTNIRFVKSISPFHPHTDKTISHWELRNMFVHEHPKEQWYFTPLDKPEEKTYLTLPDDTNWFAYKDGSINHGTDFDPDFAKIIVLYFVDELALARHIMTQVPPFPGYAIYRENGKLIKR